MGPHITVVLVLKHMVCPAHLPLAAFLRLQHSCLLYFLENPDIRRLVTSGRAVSKLCSRSQAHQQVGRESWEVVVAGQRTCLP